MQMHYKGDFGNIQVKYFDSVTGGWVSYSINHSLISLISHSLVCTSSGHDQALLKIKSDIEKIKSKRRM